MVAMIMLYYTKLAIILALMKRMAKSNGRSLVVSLSTGRENFDSVPHIVLLVQLPFHLQLSDTKHQLL